MRVDERDEPTAAKEKGRTRFHAAPETEFVGARIMASAISRRCPLLPNRTRSTSRRMCLPTASGPIAAGLAGTGSPKRTPG
jgi:hypothetical protein